MNEVSIIINGVRYDAVETTADIPCKACDFLDLCVNNPCLCKVLGVEKECFKKSDKQSKQ